MGTVELDAHETIEIEDAFAETSTQCYYRAVRLEEEDSEESPSNATTGPTETITIPSVIPLVAFESTSTETAKIETFTSRQLTIKLAPVLTKHYQIPKPFAATLSQEATAAKGWLTQRGIAWSAGTTLSDDNARHRAVQKHQAPSREKIDAIVRSIQEPDTYTVEISVIIVALTDDELARLRQQ
ncbi:MAG: hypothetical protein ACI9DF_004004 [Verrucomicrobiales bacterium]|jgi:hypothetical protein